MKELKTKEFWEAAGARALRTFCQTFLAVGGSAVLLEDIDLKYSLSAAAMAAIFSLVTSIITGLPEVEE